MNIDYYESPIGLLKIIADDQYVYELSFVKEKDEKINKNYLTLQLKKELSEYFNGTREKFNIKVKLVGTEFQIKVWKALMEIPYGKVCSYKDIAIKINNPLGAIAVGNANHNNKLLILVPCHRVIGSNNKLVGFALGLDAKSYLLDLEKNKKVTL